MLLSPDPSKSLTLLKEWMTDNDKTTCEYYHSEDWSSYPKVDGEECQEIVMYCSDIIESEEYESPTEVCGFVLKELTLTWV